MKRYKGLLIPSEIGSAEDYYRRVDVEAQAAKLRTQITELQARLLDTEQQLADVKENYEGAGDCLNMVKDCLEQLGLDMSARPPMFYPEAICRVVQNKVSEAESGKKVLS